MNEVSIGCRDMGEPPWRSAAEAFALKAMEQLGLRDWSLSLLFCGDEFMQSLNREYRGRDEATDVLSFPMGESLEEAGCTRYIAGDIVISLPAMERNTAEFEVGADEELKRLLVHGILHLSGRDHENNDESQPMLVEQERILAALQGEHIL
ncbi:MAG: rRNA maturation RNase YbeY [Spirochaetia bacterium]|nr:rRNA maturation RNase YbeY [Spirochaetia bacterium]